MNMRSMLKLMLSGLLAWPLVAWSSDPQRAEELLARGDYAEAAPLLGEMLTRQPQDASLWLRRGESYQALGFIDPAIEDFTRAVMVSETTRDHALAQLALGQALHLDQQSMVAETHLRQGLEDALEVADPALLAGAYSRLGGLQEGLGRSVEARQSYESGLDAARASARTDLQAELHLNLSRLGDDQRALEDLHDAWRLARDLPAGLRATMLAAAIGYQAMERQATRLAFDALNVALRGGRALGNSRLQSEALGYLGRLYENNQRWQQSLSLTQEAVMAAAQADARDLLLHWEWQQARVLKAMGDDASALAAYRRSVQHVQAVRADIPVTYQKGQSSFRKTLEPIYLGLMDALLGQAEQSDDEARRQTLLAEAQSTIELLKTAELQDYFKDSCAVRQRKGGNATVVEGTAILYPVIFPRQLKLLYQIGDTRYVRSVPVPAGKVRALASRMVKTLRPTPSGYLRPFSKGIAGQLYKMLVKPLEKDLKANKVDTIVYVPDGVLRSFPIAALWDGKDFLVRRYASATVVGMSLTDDAPSELGQIEALLSGVANPGGVVEELPPAMLRSLAIDPVPALDETKSRRIAVRSLPATAARDPAEATADATDDQALIKMDAVTRSNLQQALALPGVKVELDKLSGILNARPLLDEAFRRGVFEEEMKKNYRIVHIASHGVFSGDPKDSFIITYDHTLDMNRLEELFKSESFSDQPVEILTLSACQTAEGDDRSPLGLSGVAIKSGARSALGSLWPVSDDAAQILLPSFYTNLSEQGLGKARSLQQAQIALLQQPEFEHPTFWASFVLVGNWL